MLKHEHGLSTIDIIVGLLIMSVIALGSGMTIFQVMKVTTQSNSDIMALQHLQNAGYWIGRDAQMADNVNTDNLSSNEFLKLSWTEGDSSENITDHVVTYYFDDLSGNIGKLKRNHWTSLGLNNVTLVSQYICFNQGDPVNISNVSFSNPLLTLKLIATFAEASETREYQVICRPKL